MARVELIDFLVWIETHSHHKVTLLENSKGKGLMLEGHGGDNIRFYPTYYQDGDVFKIDGVYEPSRDPFDSRVYRATAAGRKIIRENGRWPEVAAKQKWREPGKKGWKKLVLEGELAEIEWAQDKQSYDDEILTRREIIALQEKWGERGAYFTVPEHK